MKTGERTFTMVQVHNLLDFHILDGALTKPGQSVGSKDPERRSKIETERCHNGLRIDFDPSQSEICWGAVSLFLPRLPEVQ